MKNRYNKQKHEKVNINSDLDDNILNNFNILSLFGKEILEDIQEKVSKATGLAFVTVDYKGEPITKMTSFTKFCNEIRKRTGGCDCKASDAFGGIQSAVTQKNWVYFCPCGLLEIAIPIIVKEHYLGGFIGGQVRCLDAPDCVSRFENVLNNSKKEKKDEFMQKLFNETPLYKYEQFLHVADLVSLIINQLAEKEAYRLMQNNSLNKRVDELVSINKNLELENKLKDFEYVNLKSELNPYFLINVLNSISNLSIIENTHKTNKMIVMFAEYIKRNFGHKSLYIKLKDEIKNIEKYFEIQKVKYGDSLKYEINLKEKSLKYKKIPCNIIMPFVENAVFYGIATKSDGGKVEINIYCENDDMVISIYDNGLGFSDEDIDSKFKIFNGDYEGEYIKISIKNSREKLVILFGKKYDVNIEKIEGKGTKATIKCPLNFDEGNE